LVGLAKQWLPFSAVIGAVGVLAVTLAIGWPHLASLQTPQEVAAELGRMATTGAAGIVLWPFRAIVRLPLSASPAEFWAALPWALLVVAANYVWVVRADAAFEEASAERAEKVAVRLAAIRAGRLSTPTVRSRATTGPSASATPFALALTGRPETAILWKNLIMIGRYVSLKTLWRIVPFLILIGVIASQPGRQGGFWPLVGMLCFIGIFFTVLLGPQMARNDLRQDLAQLSVLKTWPVSGSALVRGELLAPAVVLTGIAWVLTIAGGLLAGSLNGMGGAAASMMVNRLSFGIAVMVVAPGVILAQLVVQNGMAIVFPAWVAIGANRARGIEATGQRLLMLAGNLLTLLLSLLPGVVVGGGIALVVYWMTGVMLIVLPALVLGTFMLAECWLASEVLGRVLDRTDVSAVEAVE
jgi:ABC-2 type transport system permease protein